MPSQFLPFQSNGSLMTEQCTDQCVVITCNDPEHDNGISCYSLYSGFPTSGEPSGLDENHLTATSSREQTACFSGCNDARSGNNACQGQGQCDYFCPSGCSVKQVHGSDAQGTGQGQQCETERKPVANSTDDIQCANCMPVLLDEILQFQCCADSNAQVADARLTSIPAQDVRIGVGHRNPSFTWDQAPADTSLLCPCDQSDLPCTENCPAHKASWNSFTDEQRTVMQEFFPLKPGSTSEVAIEQRQEQRRTVSDSVPHSVSTVLTCQWGSCQADFCTAAELVGHVNLHHLHPSPSSSSCTGPTPSLTDSRASPTIPSSQPTLSTSPRSPTNLPNISCLWRDCDLSHPPIEDICSPIYPPTEEALRDILADHLYRDHLGFASAGAVFAYLGMSSMSNLVHPQQSQMPSLYGELSNEQSSIPESRDLDMLSTPSLSPSLPSPVTTHTAVNAHAFNLNSSLRIWRALEGDGDMPSCMIEESVTSPPENVPNAYHKCMWQGCNDCFKSSDEVTRHLSLVHVGSGHTTYECFWKGCTRNGDAGFTSKQKISRHLQSHTGHRPFQCSVCHQYFSEAATLQQHMRRHTREKPYMCDQPGCGKTFAIAGALTIHKRMHSGQRPFKCPHCDRAFAESSNLSKHLRTHTGVRPYSCTEPGCIKTFARPDQLNRHLSVHRRKSRPLNNQ
ncbi:hypothetical protein AX17_002654 [Amanita inopinata Kibby_2008]|nr:hypothetical protein AX17_002654 [Amanita inopinata Kibby_2008]